MYTFTTTDCHNSSKTYRLKESQLKRQHKDLLLGQLLHSFNNAPDEVKNNFLQYISREFEKQINISVRQKIGDFDAEHLIYGRYYSVSETWGPFSCEAIKKLNPGEAPCREESWVIYLTPAEFLSLKEKEGSEAISEILKRNNASNVKFGLCLCEEHEKEHCERMKTDTHT